MRRGAEAQTDQGPRLSERSEFERDPGWAEHRWLPVAQRRDAGTRVAFFWLTLFWRSKRKVSRPPQRQSGTGLSSGVSARFGSKEIRKRAFSGSEHKFPSPLARPAGASQGNCDPTPKTMRLALRVLRFAAQRNCDPTLKTRFGYVSCRQPKQNVRKQLSLP